MELIFATGNRHKVIEVEQVLGPSITLIMPKELGITEDIPENGIKLEENAIEKSRYIWERTHRACFADDTGLEVDALGGAPGVHTARYAGNDKNPSANMDKLLAELSKLGERYENPEMRKARFRTVVALHSMTGELHLFEGVLEGRIALSKSGTEGFGYDPIFIPVKYAAEGKSLAEISMEIKNSISHRGKAIRALKRFLEEYTGTTK